MAYLMLLLALCAATVFITLGSWSALARTPLQARWLLVPALVIPIVLRFVDLPTNRINTLGFGLYLAAYGCLLTFTLLNLSVRGMAVVAVGVALNTFVIGLNHGMPTKAVDGKAVTTTALHKPRESTDLLPMLGDVIVLPLTRETISFGDLIIGVGLINVVFRASRSKKRGNPGEETEIEPTPDESMVPIGEPTDTWMGGVAEDPAPTVEVPTVEVPTATSVDATLDAEVGATDAMTNAATDTIVLDAVPATDAGPASR